MKQIGNLFILRININLVGSILDSPEFFWYVERFGCVYHLVTDEIQVFPRFGATVHSMPIIS